MPDTPNTVAPLTDAELLVVERAADVDMQSVCLGTRHDARIIKRLIATVRAAQPHPCFECGGTEMLGPICATCNPEIAAQPSQGQAPKMLVDADWLRRRVETDPDCEVEAGTMHPEAPQGQAEEVNYLHLVRNVPREELAAEEVAILHLHAEMERLTKERDATIARLRAELEEVRRAISWNAPENGRPPIRRGQASHPSPEGELREAMQLACDLLAERTHGSRARSPGHNARLVLESALSSQEGGK